MPPTVFIETTIPSFYFESRKDPTIVARRLSTRRWWDQWRGRYSLVTCEGVLTELGRTPEPKRSRMIVFMKGVEVVSAPAGLDRVAAFQHRLMPRNAQGDAQHMAFASLIGADFLLTWNCRHLANQSKVRHLTVMNRRLGLDVPVLTTPDTLLPEDLP